MKTFSKIDYSIGLLQKAEKLALEMDPEDSLKGTWDKLGFIQENDE